jgi:hypothetical protein
MYGLGLYVQCVYSDSVYVCLWRLGLCADWGYALDADWAYVRTGVIRVIDWVVRGLSFSADSYMRTGFMCGLGLFADWAYVRTGVICGVELYAE